VVGDKPATGTFYCKADGVLCGTPFADAIFQHLGCVVEWNFEVSSSILCNHGLVLLFL
jgi:nicotinate-nucleotide pyrophosphorylase